MDSSNPILDAYNEGLGDGLVAATAIMSNAGNKIVQEIKAEIAEKRPATFRQRRQYAETA